MKKGYFFSIDVVVATIIITIGIFLVFFAHSNEPYSTATSYLANDIISILASMKVNEIDNAYVNNLTENNTITNYDYTLLEQMGEFYYKMKQYPSQGWEEILEKYTENICYSMTPQQYEMQVLIKEQDAEDYEEVYQTNDNQEEAIVLTSSKRVVYGVIDKYNLWGPYVVEVRVWQV